MLKKITIHKKLNISGDLSITDLSVFDVVRQYSELGNKGFCDATPETIGDELFVSGKTAWRSLKALVSAGLLTDKTPFRRSKTHEYSPSQTALDIIINGQIVRPGMTNCPTKTELTDKLSDQKSLLTDKLSDDMLLVVPLGNGINDFGGLYASWLENLGELGPRKIELLGDYYDEQPEWTVRAYDETVSNGPRDPWPYFRRIINDWIKNGGPKERPSPTPPPKDQHPTPYKNNVNKVELKRKIEALEATLG